MQGRAPDPEPDRLTPEETAERRRRQRSRSLAIAAVLVALVVLFYVVTIIQLSINVGGFAE